MKNGLLLATGDCARILRKLELLCEISDIYAHIRVYGMLGEVRPQIFCASVKNAVMGEMKEL